MPKINPENERRRQRRKELTEFLDSVGIRTNINLSFAEGVVYDVFGFAVE